MKKGIKAIIAVSLFSLLSTVSQASEVGLVCDNCSDSGYKDAAKASVGLGYHTVWVFDTVRWKATQWSVSVEQEGSMTWRFATEEPLNNDVTVGFAKYKTIVQDFLIPSRFRPIDIPSSLFNSAYEVVANPDALNDLVDWYRLNSNFAQYSLDWAGSAFIALTTKVSSFSACCENGFLGWHLADC